MHVLHFETFMLQFLDRDDFSYEEYVFLLENIPYGTMSEGNKKKKLAVLKLIVPQ